MAIRSTWIIREEITTWRGQLVGREGALTVNYDSFRPKSWKQNFDLTRSLNWGILPFVQEDPDQAPEILSAYLNTYLRKRSGKKDWSEGSHPLSDF